MPAAWTALGRSFAVAGSRLALASFLVGAKGLLFFHAVAHGGPEVAAAYGLSLTVLTLLAVGAVGLQVVIVSGLARHRDLPAESLSEVGAAGALFVLASTLATSAVGLVLSLSGVAGAGADVLSLAYWSRFPAVVLLLVTSVVTAFLVLLGRERVAMWTAVLNFVVTAAVAAALSTADLGGPATLVVIGVASALTDSATAYLGWRGVGPDRHAVRRALAAGALAGLRRPRAQLAALGRVLAGASEGLLLVGAFAVIVVLAARVDAVTAAVTAGVIAFVRTLVVPLKSFGLVAGRLVTGAGSDELNERARMRICLATVSIFFVPLGVACLLAPEQVHTLVVGSADLAPHAGIVLRLVGVQLLLEPVTGFASATLKVLLGPAANLQALALSLWGLAVPSIFLLLLDERLTLGSLWSVWLASRLVYFALVLRTYLTWERHR